MWFNTNHQCYMQKFSRLFLGVALLSGLLLLTTSCGGGANLANNGGGGEAPTLFGAPATTPMQVWVGAQPGDRILSLRLQVTSVQLKKSSDSSATNDLLYASDMELTRLAATYTPVAVAGVTPNTFDQLQMAVSGARVTYLDANGAVQEKNVIADQTSVLTLNPVVTVGDIPTMLSIVVDVNQTVQVDPVNNLVTLNAPVVSVVQSDIPSSGGGAPASVKPVGKATAAFGANQGQIERLIGQVVDATSDSIILQLGQSGLTLSLRTDGNTMFDNSSPDTVNGMLVKVQGRAMTDGTLYASSVEGLFPDSGMLAEGMLGGTNPSGTLKLVAGDGMGAGMTPDMVGATISVASDQGPGYMVDLGSADMNGLPLLFDETHIAAGQRIEVRSDFGLQADPDGNAAQAQPYLVELLYQTLQGTVQNYQAGDNGAAEFDLLLTKGSSLVLMNGDGTVHIYQRYTTHASGAIADGMDVNVRGLLFCTDATDSVPPGTPLHFAMVAAAISGND